MIGISNLSIGINMRQRLGDIIPPALAAPVNTVLPSISGTLTVGDTLTGNRGTWTGNPTPTYTYAWWRDGVAISGATSLTYVTDTAGVHTFRATATNSEGVVTAMSAGVTVAAAALPTVTLDTAGAPTSLAVNASEAGQVYYLLSTFASRTGAQVIAGGGLASGNFAASTGTTSQAIDWSGVAAGDYTLHVVLVAGGVNSLVATAPITLAAVGYTAKYMTFSGTAWLERGGSLIGNPATTQNMLYAATYSPGAADMGATKDLFAAVGNTNQILTVQKTTFDKFDIKIKDNTNTLVYRLLPQSTALTVNGKYLILISVNGATDGAKCAVIDLSNGSTIATASVATTGITLAPQADDWVVAAASGLGVRAIAGQMERTMFWTNAGPNVSLSTIQNYFHTSGALRSPADVVTSVGAAPIINISGLSLANGTNAGSGGNLTKDGAGTITESV